MLHRALDAVMDAVAQKPPKHMQAVTSNMMERLVKHDWANKVRDINTGWCGTWAEKVQAKDPSVEIWASDEHMFIKKGGKYYDAETPGGVTDWRKLRGQAKTSRLASIRQVRKHTEGFGYNHVPRL
jgi:hypothetical protein